MDLGDGVSQEIARKIMGNRNFIGSKELSKHFEQKIDPENILFSKETIKMHRNSHILFLVFNQTFNCNEWFLVQKYAIDKYRLELKSYRDQEEYLGQDEYIGSYMVYEYLLMILQIRNYQLFLNNRIWCSDINNEGKRIFVGWNDKNNISISSYWDIFCPPQRISIVPMKKRDFMF